jgi:hypothetical protein
MAADAKALKEAKEAGKIEARKELGKWLDRTVYSDIFPSMIERLKAGKSL